MITQPRESNRIGSTYSQSSAGAGQQRSQPRGNISGSSLVENRITGLLRQDNPYMQQAELQGKQQAASRGLLNSSIGVGAIEQERIRAALPIAQQDASLYGQRDLSHQNYLNNSDLSAQNYQQNRGLADQSFGHSTQLADQAFGHNTSLNDQRFDHSTQLADQSFGHNSQLADQTFGHNSQLSAQTFGQNQQLQDQTFGHNSQLSAQNHNQGLLQTQQQHDLGLQTNFQESHVQFNQQRLNQITQIEADPNLSPEQKAAQIGNVNAAYQNYLNGLPGNPSPQPVQQAAQPVANKPYANATKPVSESTLKHQATVDQNIKAVANRWMTNSNEAGA